MAHPRTFRFGIQLATAAKAADWVALARKAEDLGFSTLFLPDHFGDQLAPVPALMAAADATTSLRVGALVFDNDYKHPVVLAKEAATIDVLSDGRLELGVGAGWMTSDYEQSGIPHDPAGVRIDRMIEGIAVMKGLFSEGQVTFEGKHYTVTELDGLPKPVQRPWPPFLIGGGGKRVLTVAAREADIVGINPSIPSGRVDSSAAQSASATATDDKVRWVRDAAGDRYADLELNALVFACVVTDDRKGTAEMMAPMFGVDPDEVVKSPHTWIGPIEAICDDLLERRERWDMSYVVLQGAEAMDAVAPIVARLAGT
jgi:probable F420-dependent oxidoreductase